MISHLKRIHAVNLPKKPETIENRSQQTLKFPRVNIDQKYDEVICKLATLDNLSFNQIVTSTYIQQCLKKDFYKSPTTHRTIKNIVIKVYNQKVTELKDYFHTETDQKYCATFDEWTSMANRRYIGLTIFGKKPFNLGMIHIQGSCTAVRLGQMVDDKLGQFGLSMEKSIVVNTYDGSAVNRKLGRLTNTDEQVCMVHGLHLAVINTLYTFPPNASGGSDSNMNDIVNLLFGNQNNQNSNDSDSEDVSSESDNSEDEQDHSETLIVKQAEIRETISNVRKVVKFFRDSPLRSEALQKEIKRLGAKPLKLKLDVKTRWDSMFDMLFRFNELLPSIRKCLRDLGHNQLLQNINEPLIQHLIAILEPIKSTNSVLKNDGNDLVATDTALEWLLGKLNSFDTPIAISLFNAVKFRIEERRNVKLSSIAMYLNDPTDYEDLVNRSLLEYSSKSEIHEESYKLLQRLYNSPTEVGHQAEDTDATSPQASTSYSDTLQNAIAKAKKPKPVKKTARGLTGLIEEFESFEKKNEQSTDIKKLKCCLECVRTVSIAPERTFSLAANFVTGKRNRLGDDTLDALIFLKYYFLNN